jgi:curli production assembly/transport component CsgF
VIGSFFYKLWFVFIAITFPFNALLASQLVYTPVNPSFGGSGFNSSHLLGTADANNRYEAPQKDYSITSSLVTNSVLSAISSNISNTILKSTNGQSGSFNTGTDIISYVNTGGKVTLTIINNATGETTTLSLIPGV